jgi:hypothetical protein
MTGRQPKVITYDQAHQAIKLQYKHIIDNDEFEDEKKDNFERYVIPSLARGAQRPLPAGNSGSYACQFPFCGGVSFKSKQTYVRHLRVIHGEWLPLQGAFLSPSSTILRSDGRPFICVECNKPFTRHDHLRQHLFSKINFKCAKRYPEHMGGEKRNTATQTMCNGLGQINADNVNMARSPLSLYEGYEIQRNGQIWSNSEEDDDEIIEVDEPEGETMDEQKAKTLDEPEAETVDKRATETVEGNTAEPVKEEAAEQFEASTVVTDEVQAAEPIEEQEAASAERHSAEPIVEHTAESNEDHAAEPVEQPTGEIVEEAKIVIVNKSEAEPVDELVQDKQLKPCERLCDKLEQDKQNKIEPKTEVQETAQTQPLEQENESEEPLSQMRLVSASELKKMNRTLSNLTLSQEHHREYKTKEEDDIHYKTEQDHE